MRRADVTIVGTLDEKVFDGVSTDLYLFKDERIGMITVGVQKPTDVEIGREYEMIASLYGVTTTHHSGKTMHSNRLAVQDYQLKGEK